MQSDNYHANLHKPVIAQIDGLVKLLKRLINRASSTTELPKNSKKHHSWSFFAYLASKLMDMAKSSETLVSTIGFILAGIILAVLLSNQLNAAITNPYFTPIGVVEETAYVYISANNFIDYGYWQSGFLQDMAYSSDPADHPYIYNHMPPGSDIFLSLLLRLSGKNYTFTRVVYALIFISGVVVYLWFVTLIFKPLKLKGAAESTCFNASSLDRKRSY